MNMVFPKEEIKLIENIKNLYKDEEYFKIAKLKDEIINNKKFIYEYDSTIFDMFSESLFKIREFEQVISFTEDMRTNDIETYGMYFYCLFSLIEGNDLYYCKSIINKIKIIEKNNYELYINDEESDYSMIFALPSKELITVGPLLILINFINELVSETLKVQIKTEYVIMRCFDLLNLLYENGVGEDTIKIFRNAIETVYEIQID